MHSLPGDAGQPAAPPAPTVAAAAASAEAGTPADAALVTEVAARLERLFGLLRWLSPAGGLSLTAGATLATLDRLGPSRVTDLAAGEGVTQPAMTQLVGRLQDSGLVQRVPDPSDGRVVLIRITEAGRDMLAARRAVRAGRLAVLVGRLTPAQQQLLAGALPVIDILARAPQQGPPPPGTADPVLADAGRPAHRAAATAQPPAAKGTSS